MKSAYNGLAARIAAPLVSALSSAKEEGGQGMTEYAVALTLLAVVLIAAIGGLRDAVLNIINDTAGRV